MPDPREENAPKPTTGRMRDISAWQEGDISSLKAKGRKRYRQRKAAIEAYFTTDEPLRNIVEKYHLSSEEALLRMAKRCLLPHEDGDLWGFRALQPGATVIAQAPESALETTAVSEREAPTSLEEPVCVPMKSEEQTETLVDTVETDEEEIDTAKREAVKLPQSMMQVPETPLPETLLPVSDEEAQEGIGDGEPPVTAPEETIPPQTAEHTTETGEVDDPPLSEEAEDAIAEVERILERQKDAHGQYVPSPVERDTETAQQSAKVTAPLAVVVAERPPLVVRVPADRHTAVTVKRTVPGRVVRKRWQRIEQIKAKRPLQILSVAVLAALVFFVLIPVGAGFAAYGAYNNVNAMAHDGINHLLKVKSLLNVSKSDPLAALNATKLQQAQLEFRAAESDFEQLQQLASRPDIQSAVVQFAPAYASKLGEAQSLVQVALDVSRMGDELSGVGILGANLLHGSPLASSSARPLLTATDATAIEGAMTHALYYITDIRLQLSHVSIKDLPISAAQKSQLNSILPLLPQVQNMIEQAQGLSGAVTWLLGIDHPRRFLIQTMDDGELRPGGGFTGQYGILQIQDGRVTPPSITDVTLLDYAGNGTAIGRSAPPGYSWMNFGNWGIRDSNLSGDFPTTARMTMQLFQDEGGGPVDGDIAFTPALIAHILDVIGPIKVPAYNETITSKNLEERLHYYQQDFSAIAKEKAISGNYSHSGRKAFTSTLGKILLDRVRHLQPKQLMAVFKGALKDMQSHDLQIYFANPVAEAWLVAHGYSGSIDTFSTVDGFVVSQANISISKASSYVHTTEQDTITLDAQGGATHNLTITLDYNQTGPVYGNDTYADYIRVYAPKNAQFTDGYGFDSGHAICSPKVPVGKPPTSVVITGCGSYDSSFNGARYCANGNYSLGLNGMLAKPWTVDSLGPPTAQTSDLPGRSMWGGMTETPKNCTSTITLSWYVPHAVKFVNGHPIYTLLVQKQAGMVPTIEINVDASAIKGLKSLSFKGDIVADKTFVLVVPSKRK